MFPILNLWLHFSFHCELWLKIMVATVCTAVTHQNSLDITFQKHTTSVSYKRSQQKHGNTTTWKLPSVIHHPGLEIYHRSFTGIVLKSYKPPPNCIENARIKHVKNCSSTPPFSQGHLGLGIKCNIPWINKKYYII